MATFQPGVIPANSLVPVASGIQRMVALVLLLTSTLGTYVQFNGGWERIWVFDERAGQAALYALLWQILFFLWQFSMIRVRAWRWYIFALLASAVPSFMSYYDLAYPWLVAYIGRYLPDGPDRVLTVVILLVAVVGNDMVPEQVLVKR